MLAEPRPVICPRLSSWLPRLGSRRLVATLALLVAVAARADDPGFVPIFDGTSLEGWEGKAGHWRVEDGAIVGRSTAEVPCDATTYLLREGVELEDFELVAEYKVVGGNSGIQFRSRDLGGHQVAGPQADHPLTPPPPEPPWI